MKRVAFTIAFGKKRYEIMARALGETVARHSPGVEFRIFGDADITPYHEGLPRGRRLYPKDYKYPKIEIMTKLRDPDTQYLFIDADCFVFCSLDSMFERIEAGKLLMHWVYNEDGSWAGIPALRFAEAWAQEGVEGLEPFSLNSGFIGWQGHMPCFDKALELIKTKTVMADDKGRRGDEYYYCAGIQLTRTDVVSTESFPNELGMFWRGRIGYQGGRLTCAAYPEGRLIQHYGNPNWSNRHVQRVIRETLRGESAAEKRDRYLYSAGAIMEDKARECLRVLRRQAVSPGGETG